MQVYRLRWQIELLLERWKFLRHLDLLLSYRQETPATRLRRKLLLILCADELSNAATFGFPPSAHQASRKQEPASSLPHQPWKSLPMTWQALRATRLPTSQGDLHKPSA